MLAEQEDTGVYEFSDFRLDIAQRRLWRDGEPVALAPKAFDLLALLVRNNGQLLTKQELMDYLWPDAAVDEANLPNNISILRRTLAPESFIETVPRFGYRFQGDVKAVEPLAQPDITIERRTITHIVTEEFDIPDRGFPAIAEKTIDIVPTALPPAPARGTKLRMVGLTLGLIVAGGIGGVLWERTRRTADGPPPRLVPLTGLRGWECDPAFSPDGRRVAYAWNGRKQDNFDIYITAPGGTSPRRLTDHPAREDHPVWSPDGTRIAFLRLRAGEGADAFFDVVLKSVETEGERIIGTAGWPGLDWSPDGKLLIVADRLNEGRLKGLFLIDADTGARRLLPTGAAVDCLCPTFSPDGSRVAFIQGTASSADIFTIHLDGRGARQVTFDTKAIERLAWHGTDIVYTSDRSGQFAVWRVPATGGTPTPVGAAVGPCSGVTVASRGDKLAYQQWSADFNVWRQEADKAPEQVVASTQSDDSPHVSPDGRRIVYSSNQSGAWQIWVANADGSDPKPVTDFVGHGVTGSPRWSPDGQWIAFDSGKDQTADVYVVSPDGGEPRKLTDGETTNVLPAWSVDGRWIFFCSRRTGDRQIWKVPVAGGPLSQVTYAGGWESWAAPDGKLLYYTKGRNNMGVWTVPVDGGPETLVPELAEVGRQRYWTVTEKGVWFAVPRPDGGADLKRFDPIARQIVTVFQLPTLPKFPTASGLSVSPDGRSVHFLQNDQSQSRIVVIEGFR